MEYKEYNGIIKFKYLNKNLIHAINNLNIGLTSSKVVVNLTFDDKIGEYKDTSVLIRLKINKNNTYELKFFMKITDSNFRVARLLPNNLFKNNIELLEKINKLENKIVNLNYDARIKFNMLAVLYSNLYVDLVNKKDTKEKRKKLNLAYVNTLILVSNEFFKTEN